MSAREAEHTAGWKLAQDVQDVTRGDFHIHDAAGFVGTFRSAQTTPRQRSVANANARLIAQAPDLLAALERITLAVDNAAAARGRMTGEEGRALDSARAVLARAKGGAR